MELVRKIQVLGFSNRKFTNGKRRWHLPTETFLTGAEFLISRPIEVFGGVPGGQVKNAGSVGVSIVEGMVDCIWLGSKGDGRRE